MERLKRADGLIRLVPQVFFSADIEPTSSAENIQNIYSETLSKYKDKILFISEKFKDKDSAELGELATALYIIKCFPEADNETLRKELENIAPYIPVNQIEDAIQRANSMIEEVRDLRS